MLARLCVALLASLCLLPAALGKDRSIQQYVHSSWGEAEGAPSGIDALAQTTDGYLWIGSYDGLFRFDGASFELLDPDFISALFAPSNGDLWYAARSKIIRLSKGQKMVYGAQEGVPDIRVRGLAADSEGGIWAATETGLLHFDGKRWARAGSDWNFPGKEAWGMYLDRKGTLWVATENSIVYLLHGSHSFHATGITVGAVPSITEAPNGKLWMAETTRAVRPVPLGMPALPLDQTQISFGSQEIAFDHEGGLWISTLGDGLHRISHPQALEPRDYKEPQDALDDFRAKDGLTNDFMVAVLTDHEGNIWTATKNGLDCFRKGALLPIVPPFPLGHTLLTPGLHDEMWIFSDAKLVATPDGLNFQPMPVSGQYIDSADGPDGTVWWSDFNAVYRQRDGAIKKTPLTGIEASFNWPLVITADHDGTLWVAVSGVGLYFLKQDEAWQRAACPPEMQTAHPVAAYTDPLGRVWFGFGDGTLVVVENGVTHIVATATDSPTGGAIGEIAGRGRHLWVGGRRLAFFDGHQFHPMFSFDDTPLGAHGLDESEDGSLWLTQERGIVQIPPAEVTKFLHDYHYPVHYRLFTSADGLPGLAFDPYSASQIAEGSDGRLWFTATRGVAWLDPKNIPSNTLPPPVSIRYLDVDKKRYDADGSVTLPPQPVHLSIAYTALSLSVPSRVRFRYKLDGVDKEWQDPGTRREAVYTRLAPGRYRFHVIACNNDGVWNEEGATLDFRVKAAWFQALWFRVLCLLASGSLLWSLYRLRLRQVAQAMNVRFNERMIERTRIARDLHDTLLQTIQGSKLVAVNALRRADASSPLYEPLQSISNWLGQASEEGRAALQSLRISTAETSDLIARIQGVLEDARSDSPVEAGLQLQGNRREMYSMVCDELYMIGYEACRNAYSHSQCSHLEISLTYGNDFSLEIRDNGIGMDAALLQNGKNGHFGLHGMRERAKRMHAHLSIESLPGSGTIVTVTIPGKRAYRASHRSWIAKIKNSLRPRPKA